MTEAPSDSHLNPLWLVSLFPSDFSFWDSSWKMKLSKCICLLWKLYPCNHIIWNLRKQKKNPDFVHLTSSLSVTASFVVIPQGMPKEGEEKTWKKGKGKEYTNTCMWQYLLLQDTPIPCEPEINPRALSVEYIWETSTDICLTETGEKRKGRKAKWGREEVY